MPLATLAVLVASYLFASWNFAITVLRIGGFPDPRTMHSGNAGTSNVARVAGWPLAGLVLVLELARAMSIHLVAARWCTPDTVPWAGFALVLGNRFPIFHGFHGGKGVAAYLGFVGAAQPWAAMVACGAWLVTYLPSKIPALASMAMVLVLVGAVLRGSPISAVFASGTIVTAALIVAGHKRNWVAWRGRHRK